MVACGEDCGRGPHQPRRTVMLDFSIHSVLSAPAASRAILEDLRKEVGFLPNLAATMAESPTLVEAFTTLRSIVRRGSLTGSERAAVAIVLSVTSRCTYCVAAYSGFALGQGTPPAAVAALRAGDWPDGAPRLAALARFTRALIERRGFASSSDLAALEQAGLSAAQALEVVAMMGMVMLANYAHNITGVALDEAFSAQAWSLEAQRAPR